MPPKMDFIPVFTRREKPSEPLTQEWAKGEVHANSIEIRVLDRITGNAWSEAAMAVVADTSVHRRHVNSLVIPTQEGIDRALSTLPDSALCRTERISRVAIALATILFAQVETPEERAEAYLLHQKLGPNISEW